MSTNKKKKYALDNGLVVQTPPLLYDPLINLIGNVQEFYTNNSNPILAASNAINNPTTHVSTVVTNNPSAVSPNAVTYQPQVMTNTTANAINVQNTQTINNITAQITANTQTMSANASTSQQAVANAVASNINKVLTTYGSQNVASIQNSLYSSGINGYSVVPVYNSSGLVQSVEVVNNAQTLANTSNLISNTPNGTTSTAISASSLTAPVNTTVGYLNGQGVLSKGSSYTGSGYYLNSAGAPSYISNYNQYKTLNQNTTNIVTTANGITTTMNPNGVITSITNSNGKTTSIPANSQLVYNSNGSLNSVVLPSGQTVSFNSSTAITPVTMVQTSSGGGGHSSSNNQPSLYTTPAQPITKSNPSTPSYTVTSSGSIPIVAPAASNAIGTNSIKTTPITVKPVNATVNATTPNNYNNSNNFSVTTTIPNNYNATQTVNNNAYNNSIFSNNLFKNVSQNSHVVQTITSPSFSLSSFFNNFHW